MEASEGITGKITRPQGQFMQSGLTGSGVARSQQDATGGDSVVRAVEMDSILSVIACRGVQRKDVVGSRW